MMMMVKRDISVAFTDVASGWSSESFWDVSYFDTFSRRNIILNLDIQYLCRSVDQEHLKWLGRLV
jgi:hypothetical protein